MKQQLERALEENYERIVSIGDYLFEHPELGFYEEETEHVICEYLEELGIPFEHHICEHGVRCTLGTGSYHIGVIADMDALLTQIDGKLQAYHSCGHSIQVAVLLNVIAAFCRTNAMETLEGKISFFFTPAEEYIDLDRRRVLQEEGKIRYLSGKQNMIYEGYMDDLDVVLSCHVMGPDPARPEAKFDINSTLAGFILKDIHFQGTAAHAGVIPHLGRNALQAATLSLTAIQMLKDTFAPEAGSRVFPILKEGGTTANTICEHARLETYLRIIDDKELFRISEQITNACNHCALALETTCKVVDTNGYLPLKQNRQLNEIVYRNMRLQCEEKEIIHDVVSGASGDIGDVSFLIPTIQFGFSGIQGNVHSNEFTIVDPKHCYEDTAKVLAGTIVDLLEHPDWQIRNESFAQKKEFYFKHWLRVDA